MDETHKPVFAAHQLLKRMCGTTSSLALWKFENGLRPVVAHEKISYHKMTPLKNTIG
jgi:hypothetical protein